VLVDVLYGDYEGIQRTIARFGLASGLERQEREHSERAEILRYWDVNGSCGRVDPTGTRPD
jgi:hypothetical protein